MTDETDPIVIIGGGPAGLFAAEAIAKTGRRVAVYDAQATVGRKFLMAGRGGLNLTHSEPLDRFVTRYGDAGAWLGPMIRAFPPEALRAWAAGLGEATYVGTSGRVFPLSHKASPLLRAWLRRLDGLGVRFYPRHRWVGFADDGHLNFLTHDGSATVVCAQQTILALGGASWPHLGSDGLWVEILGRDGVAIAPLRAANCGYCVDWPVGFADRWAGVPLKTIAVTVGDHRSQGEGVVTAAGLEGGVFYALGPQIGPILAAGQACPITLDLKPGLTLAQVVERLSTPRRGASLSNFCRKTVNLSPVGFALLRASVEILPHEPQDLAALIKAVPIRLAGLTPLARAISTAGGIARNALDDRLMLRARPGVYAIGEMLDWEAPTGGYLLQACFAMGQHVAMQI